MNRNLQDNKTILLSSFLCIPHIVIFFVCPSSKCTDFTCTCYLSCKKKKKNASVSVYLLLNPLDCFVCSPSKTQFIPVFLWAYIPCSTFPILSWTVLLLVTLHLVFCFISLPGASQTYYSTLISAICCSVLYDERYGSSQCICHQFWLPNTVLFLKNVELDLH